MDDFVAPMYDDNRGLRHDMLYAMSQSLKPNSLNVTLYIIRGKEEERCGERYRQSHTGKHTENKEKGELGDIETTLLPT